MKIELSLWDDQSCASCEDPESTVWVMRVNDAEFPGNDCSLMSLSQAHRIACKLVEIEDIAVNE